MGLIALFIILVLLFNLRLFMRFVGVCFGLGLCLAAFALMGLCINFVSASDAVVHIDGEPVQITRKIQRHVHNHVNLVDKRLSGEIQRLRKAIADSTTVEGKALFTEHLEHLEEIQRQRDSEREALDRLQRDRAALKKLERSRRNIEKTKKSLEQELERINELEREIERSRRLMDKLNQDETPDERKIK